MKKTDWLRVFIACRQIAALSVYVTSLLDHLTYHTSQRTPHLSPCRTQRLVSVRHVKLQLFQIVFITEQLFEKVMKSPSFTCLCAMLVLGTSGTVSCVCVCVYNWPSKAQWSLYIPPSGHYMYRTVVTTCTAQWSLCTAHWSVYVRPSGHLPHSGHYMYRPVVTICTAQWSLYVPHSGHYIYRTVVTICTAQRSLYVPPV